MAESVELAAAYYSLIPSMDGTAAAIRQQSGALSGVWAGIGDDAGRGVKGGLLGGIAGAGGAIVATVAALNIGAAVGDAIKAGIDFAMDGIDLASDLGETRSAVGEVFGKTASAGIEEWASQGAGVLGQTKLDALQAAQSFGVYGKAAGLAGDDLSGFATNLADLGTDLASFFNTDTETAIAAIGSGLRGESEPLRQYGVLLDDAALKARAMQMGIYDGTGSLTQQQRVLAASAEIFAQTADAQGDFARTSGGLAGQQKIFAAGVQDAQAALGEFLLPAMTALVTMANDTFLPVLGDVIEQVGPVLGAALTDVAPQFGDLIVALAPLIPEIVRLATEALPPLVGLLVQISPFLIDWATNTAAVVEGAGMLFGLLSGDTSVQEVIDRFGQMGGSLVETARGLGNFAADAVANFVRFGTGVGQAIANAIAFVAALPGQALGALGDLGSLLFDSGQALIQGFIDGIEGMLDAAGNAVGGVLDFVAGFFPHSPAERGPFSGSGWAAVRSGGEALTEQFYSGFGDAAVLAPVGFTATVDKLKVKAAATGLGADVSAYASVVGRSVAGSPGSPGSAFPSSVVLRVGDRDFVAYLEEVADQRVAADGVTRSTVKTLGRRPGR